LDISGYIEDLLWEYECVIIPGFGGILATYRPAEMAPGEHSIYPPSKSLAFNEYLTTNDGLLVNYLYQKSQISYTEASERINAWVRKTKALLANNEEIYLPKIGRFHRDVEKNLRFEPDTTVNYLPSAYGLRKVVAGPILRSKPADTIEVMDTHKATYTLPKANKKWAMAAAIILFLTVGTVSSLLYRGVDIKPLHINAASILGLLENFDKHQEPGMGPKATINTDAPRLNVESKESIVKRIEQPVSTASIATKSAKPSPAGRPATAKEATIAATKVEVKAAKAAAKAEVISAGGNKYYVIVGAFKDQANFDRALADLKRKHPNDEIYKDASFKNKRVGLYAGDTHQSAEEKMKEIRKEQPQCWLLVKK
jgi:cell division septation protein DedD